MSKTIIEISNVYKKFSKNKFNVLQNINYKFSIGKSYSIVGPSGSGKSTLLNIISMIDKPTKGNIFINNKKINFKENSKNDITRASKIGIIYQDFNLLNDFTAFENILIARLSIENDIHKASKLTNRMLSKVKILKRKNHFPSELSGGEAQRIAICRAIVNSPQIILADEPTGSLDKKNSKEIFKLLLNTKNKNRVLIFATHNMYFANLADYKLQIIDGKLKSSNARIRKK